MHFLLVYATVAECEGLIQHFGLVREIENEHVSFTRNGHRFTILVAGVGMLPFAVKFGDFIRKIQPDVCINAGICGSYNRFIPLGTVVQVYHEFLPEAGMDDGDGFISIADSNFITNSDYPFTRVGILNHDPYKHQVFDGLPLVFSNTVLTAGGNTQNIMHRLKINPAQTENMEGASFFLTCLRLKVPCIQIRAVSNYVEQRNRDNWDIKLALDNITHVLVRWIHLL